MQASGMADPLVHVFTNLGLTNAITKVCLKAIQQSQMFLPMFVIEHK